MTKFTIQAQSEADPGQQEVNAEHPAEHPAVQPTNLGEASLDAAENARAQDALDSVMAARALIDAQRKEQAELEL